MSQKYLDVRAAGEELGWDHHVVAKVTEGASP